MTRNDIHRKQERFDRKDKGPDRKPPRSAELHCVNDVIVLHRQYNDGKIRHVAMKVIENENAPLAGVAESMVNVGFRDHAR